MWETRLGILVLLFTLSTLAAAATTLGLAVSATQGKIDAYDVATTFESRPFPSELDLRLRYFTVPFSPGGRPSSICRSFPLNYTEDAHIIQFEALSLGYPFGVQNPQEKLVRSMALFVAEPAINVAGDPGDGSNFPCDWMQPAGGAARLLWHWSRLSETQFPISPSAGILLPGVSTLILQVVYDVENGSPALSSLSSYQFWQEFQPFDHSGIRILLAPHMRPETAVVVQLGTFDFTVPALAITTVNHTCTYSAESTVFHQAVDLRVVAISTRTSDTGSFSSSAELEVHRSGGVEWLSSADPNVPVHNPQNFMFANVEQSVVVLQQGDKLVTRCQYNTRYGVSQHIEAGWEQFRELCLVHLLVWPAEAVLSPYCQSEATDEGSFCSSTG